MPTYETIFITPPNLTAEDETAMIEALTQVITEAGGSITTADRMGRRRLAYPIRKFDEGVYVRLLYDSGIEVPKELERRIRLSDQVLRGLTVRLDEEWAEQAKEQAVRDAQKRAEAEAAAAAAAKEAEAAKIAEEAAKADREEKVEEAGQSDLPDEAAGESASDADGGQPDETEAAASEPPEVEDESEETKS